MTKVIAIKDLSFSYEETLVLEDISIEIQAGEFVGIFGPNGGGKTTLLKLLMGFLKPKKGTVEIFGEHPKTVRKKIGYVPQTASFDRQFPISALEVVLMGCLSMLTPLGFFPSRVKQKAREALSRVGLLENEDQAFGTLSGGQAQRVLIARALVSDPQILLLDEPTASTDPEAEQAIYQLLEDLKGSMTILMVTHDLQAAVKRVGRLLCVQRKISSFSPSEVCEHFAMGLYHSPLMPK